MSRSDRDLAVLDSAAKLIRRTWEVVGRRAPMSTCETNHLARSVGCEVHYFPFRSTDCGQAWPSLGGVRPIFIDSLSNVTAQWLTLRHELAHALAGDVHHEPAFLAAGDDDSHAERVADLYAVADLVPTWQMQRAKAELRLWKSVELDVVLAFRELTEGWTRIRIRDRARLRVALYREHGI